MNFTTAKTILHEYGLELAFNDKVYCGRRCCEVFAVNLVTSKQHKLMGMALFCLIGSGKFREAIEQAMEETAS